MQVGLSGHCPSPARVAALWAADEKPGGGRGLLELLQVLTEREATCVPAATCATAVPSREGLQALSTLCSPLGAHRLTAP